MIASPHRPPRVLPAWVRSRVPMAIGVAVVVATSACTASVAEPAESDGVRVVATTGVLGDLVDDVVDRDGTTSVLMGDGQDPHTFQLSARDVAELGSVDLVVANGLGLEAGISEALDQAEESGVPVLRVGEYLDPLEAGHDGHGDDDHADDEHGDDDHADGGHGDDDPSGEDDHAGEPGHGDVAAPERHAVDDGHDHGTLDPHVWLDADRMSRVPGVVADALDDITPGPWQARADRLATDLQALDGEVAATMDTIPAACRRVAANHDMLHYFGDRYGLEVPVTVIPGTSSDADPSARDLAAGLDVVADADIAALVVEDTASTRLADAVATDATGLVVLSLPLSALGGPSGVRSYDELMTTVADRLAVALGSC